MEDLTLAAKKHLKLKTYIQPFEKLLAYEELKALTSDCRYTPTFEKIAEEQIEIQEHQIDRIIKKSAYWEQIISDHTQPTDQVLLEKSPKDLLSIIDFKDYPKRRTLRYGVHDLHEYRGKFFPQLVRSLINISGVKEKSRILEPFSGSGTTACEANMLNMDCFAVDLNPLSALISETKTELLNIDPELLYNITSNFIVNLRNINVELPEDYIPQSWNEKDKKYLLNWFDIQCLYEIEQILILISQQSIQEIINFYKVCLSNIIRNVSYQKESDLRVRKEYYDYPAGYSVDLYINQLNYQLEKILPFLDVKNTLTIDIGNTQIFNTSINELDINIPEQFDLLITSPPYATALPYLDTDRLSLIVLGLLPRERHKEADLKMIGNREVTELQRRQLWEYYLRRKDELPTSITDLIDMIAESNHQDGVGFRRRNLPSLLAKYFLDMLDSMKLSFTMMKDHSYSFYIVGNNSTNINGEKLIIPTNKLLFELGKHVGWKQVKLVDMELLASRDIFQQNSGNSESILIFKKDEQKRRINSGGIDRKAIYTDVSEGINLTDDWDFHDEKPSNGLHSIHPYPAKFIPQIPHKAILNWSNPNDVVLDPFCGSGTTLLEAITNNRTAIGVDNNSVACLISRAKTNSYSRDDLIALHTFSERLGSMTLDKFKDIPKLIPAYKNLDYWFSPEAIDDLGSINYLISLEKEPIKALLYAIFSAIIVNVSYQDSDTRYSRKEYKYSIGDALKTYKNKLRRLLNSLSKEGIDYPTTASVYQRDGKSLDFIESNSVDLIVTSPPYLNAYDYHKYHRHRIHWIDGDVNLARDYEIGKHDTFTRPNATPDKYFEDMFSCFNEWNRVLKNQSKLCIIIGDAVVNKQPVAVADKFTSYLIENGFTLENRWIRNLKTTKKSFNQKARMNQEHVLLFSKI
uniref:site-specific DNA-methyltransferase (cytosine-N(4)-specific) n=1 Tax=Bacillus sp. 2521 TaxID=925413 RepID=E5LGC1_9BACI|nr:M.BseYI [Bacillus sp. 2521]